MRFYDLRDIRPDFRRINSLQLIFDSGTELFSIVIGGRRKDNFIEYFLIKYNSLGPSDQNKNIKDYFFEITTLYHHKKETLEFVELEFTPGKYHQRVFRPIIKGAMQGAFSIIQQNLSRIIESDPKTRIYFPHDEKLMISSIQQLSTLTSRLTNIFNSFYPSIEHYKVYGHELRNLLILACTEVEAQLKGILVANGHKPMNKQFSIKDYSKLMIPLKLDSYKIKLSYYPDLMPFSPFQGWSRSNEKLTWYDNYNSTKHDREKDFEKANMESVLNSICAVCILLLAQYGSNIIYWKDLIGNYFEIVESPKWEIDELYLPPFKDSTWKPEILKI